MAPVPAYVVGPAAKTAGRDQPALPVTIRLRSRNREEITARRWREKAFDVPISVTVHTRDDIEGANVNDTTEIIARTPGLDFTSLSGDARNNNIGARGITTFVPIGGVDQAVGFYVDDVYIGRETGFNMDLIDIERIEILRGPQGTNYGKNTLAGAIKIETRRPEGRRTASLETSLGNFDFYSVRGHYNDVIIPGRLYGRISGGWAMRDGFVFNRLEDRDIDDLDRWGLRGQLRATPGNRWEIGFAGDVTYDRSTRKAGGPFDTITTRETAVVDSSDQEYDNYGVAIRARYDGTRYTVHSITAFRGVGYETSGSGPTESEFFKQRVDENQRQVTQEIRISSDPEKELRGTMGVFFLGEDFDADVDQELRALAPLLGQVAGFTENSVSSTRTLNGAAYGQLTKRFSHRVELTAGLRVSIENKSMDYSHTGDGGVTVLATGQTAEISETFVDASPEFTVSYNWRDLMKGYAKINRGFKSGGFNNGFVSGTDFVFDPETAWNFEVGLKSILWDGRIDLNAAAFYMDITDVQVQNFTIAGGSRTSNAASATSLGFEIESAVRPTDRWEIQAGASLADATFAEYLNAPNPERTTEDASGNRLPLASKYTVSTAIQYRRPVDVWIMLVGRVGVVWKGPMFFDALNRLREPSYSLLDARLGLEGQHWSVYLWGKNLLDETYRSFGADLGAPIGAFGFVAPPRTYGIRLKLKL